MMKCLQWYGIAIGIIVGVPPIIWGIWSAIDPKITKAPGINLPIDLVWLPLIFAAPVIIGLAGVLGSFVVQAIINHGIKGRLLQVGQKATGTITSIQDTGVTVNLNPMIHVKVKTTQGEGEFNMFVSRVGFPSPGDSIDVVYNPGKPSEMMPASKFNK